MCDGVIDDIIISVALVVLFLVSSVTALTSQVGKEMALCPVVELSSQSPYAVFPQVSLETLRRRHEVTQLSPRSNGTAPPW